MISKVSGRDKYRCVSAPFSLTQLLQQLQGGHLETVAPALKPSNYLIHRSKLLVITEETSAKKKTTTIAFVYSKREASQ